MGTFLLEEGVPKWKERLGRTPVTMFKNLESPVFPLWRAKTGLGEGFSTFEDIYFAGNSVVAHTYVWSPTWCSMLPCSRAAAFPPFLSICLFNLLLWVPETPKALSAPASPNPRTRTPLTRHIKTLKQRMAAMMDNTGSPPTSTQAKVHWSHLTLRLVQLAQTTWATYYISSTSRTSVTRGLTSLMGRSHCHIFVAQKSAHLWMDRTNQQIPDP